MSKQISKYGMAINVVAVLFIIWGVLGMMDAKNYTQSGYFTGDDWSILNVEEGSPAEAAGLQVGDLIKSTGGIAVTDTKALNVRERPAIGETREIVLDRNGEEVTLQLTYAALPDDDKTNNMIGFIIGILFVVAGVYANFKHKSDLSAAFAIFSICFGFLFLSGPYLGTGFFSTLINMLSTAVVLFSFTALVIYMLKYPQESAFLSGKNRKLIYVPMLVILAIIVVLEVTQVDNSETLNTVIRLLFGTFIISYFLIAVITQIRKYNKADATEKSSKGLTLMLIGTIIGIVPILVYFTIGTISPGTDLPGNDYVFFTFAAIPIFFTMALNKLNANTGS
ncbi:MAG: PDZ domain-containing protein [Psychroserpens sp.]|uniref:PDZ domain-containing protein n=1 Tax=Psychroserpens sp. TaxID=2020870 RepID=UPI00300323B9